MKPFVDPRLLECDESRTEAMRRFCDGIGTPDLWDLVHRGEDFGQILNHLGRLLVELKAARARCEMRVVSQ